MYNRQAYAEVDDFLEALDDDTRNEIPLELRKFFQENRDNSHHIISLEADLRNFKEETLAIIAFLNLRYWCKDREEKKRLERVYAKNEESYQNELRKKYNPNDVFKNVSSNVLVHNEEINVQENNALVKYKENFFSKFFNKIKRLFKR